MTPRTLRLLLIGSFALNVFAVGALAGGAWMVSREPEARSERRGGLRVAGAGLDQPQRRAFRQALRETNRAARPIAATARIARAEAAAAFTAPEFDAAAATAALARARAADLELRRRREERVIAFAATLSPADRATLAQGLDRGPLRRGDGSRRERR